MARLLALCCLVPSLASATTLSISGDCPGVATIEVGDIGAGSSIVIVAGSGPGSEALPGGPCGDTNSTLAGPLRHFGPMNDSDVDGEITLRPTLPGGVCGRHLVAVELSTCDVSPRRVVGGGPVDLSDLYDSWSSEGRSVYVWQSDPTLPIDDYDSFCEDRGLSWFQPESAPDAQMAIDTAYGYDAYHTWIVSKGPSGPSTWNGHAVVVDNDSCVDYNVDDSFMAIRKWACSYCDPDLEGFTRCWDAGHDYDWLMCQDA